MTTRRPHERSKPAAGSPKWRLKATAPIAESLEEPATVCSPSPGYRRANGRSARTYEWIERLHEEFKRRIKTQTAAVRGNSLLMLFWALLASGQINMRKVAGWQTLATT